MARPRRDLDTVLKIARMRYDQGMSQVAVAGALGISEATVSRSLKTAMDSGFVAIQVTAHGWRDFALEAALARRFGLKFAVVTHSREGTLDPLDRVVAGMLSDLVVAGSIVGVSDGATIASLAQSMRRGRSSDVDVVPLIGGIGAPQLSTHSTEISRVIAERLGGRAWQLPAPAVVESARTAKSLMRVAAVQSVFDTMSRTTIALVGVGAMTAEASVFRHGMFTVDELATLRRLGAVGSICSRFYDAKGQPLWSEFDERTLAIAFKDLLSVPLRLGVAFGPEKTRAIASALQGRLLNALATDVATAEALLN